MLDILQQIFGCALRPSDIFHAKTCRHCRYNRQANAVFRRSGKGFANI
jgi:hypothetical protein